MAEIGSVLGGRYRLVELLGQGGMATIFRAQDARLGRDVAVKVLRPEYGRDPDFLARFHQEAQSVASLNDPRIVSVHDFGQDPAGPFIVMEYVEGEDLATLLRRNGALAARQAARIAADVARALHVAHARGIVHRDIKPGNILIANDGRVKVTDFGIARALSEAQLTLPGTTLGSVHYFSPEQVRGEQATAASDIYALGIVLYEALTGRRPWEGDSAASVAVARLSGPEPGPSDLVASVPRALDEIVRRALARDPARRFGGAGAMADALEAFLGGVSVAPVPPAAGPAPAVVVPPPTAPAAGHPPAVGPAGPPIQAAGPGPAIPYAADAYAGAPEPPPAPVPARVGPDGGTAGAGGARGEGGGTSPWVWAAGALGLLVLVVAGYLVYQLVSGRPGTPPVEQVTVPDFVGRTLDEARATATSLGVVLVPTPQQSDRPIGTILAQDPPPDTRVDRGSDVTVTVATGTETVAVPDLRLRTEPDALASIFAAGLTNGTRGEEFDAVVPAGSIVAQDPQSGVRVARGTPVNYVVSKGPEPTPSLSPSPSPSPTPEPTATPAPTETPSPTPTLLSVGDYRCLTLDEATQQLTADGFSRGAVTTSPPDGASDGTWLVQAQQPNPSETRPPETPISFTVIDPSSVCL